MGSLSNLYISQSYTSLVHLGNDGPITSLLPGQFVELQDGLGNGLKIQLNNSGDVNIVGVLSASNIPTDIATQAELNAYTASTNIRLNNLETTTSSLNTSVSNLNTSVTNLNQFTQSANVSITNLNASSASQQVSINALNVATQSLQGQLTTIGGQSGSWVTESETGSFARVNVTNTFTQPQIINGAVTASAARISNLNYPTVDNGVKSFVQTDGLGNLSLQYVQSVYETIRNMSGGTLLKGTPVYISGSTGDNGNAYPADASDLDKMPAIYIAGEDLGVGATGIALVGGKIEGVDTTGFPAGTIIYVAEGGGWTSSRPSGSNSVVQVLGVVQKEGTGGQGVVINQLEAVLPNIQTGYVWVGNGLNQPVAFATSSLITNINTGSLVTTSSFNSYTASNDQRVSSLESNSASVNTSISNINLATSSLFTSTSLSLTTASFDNGTRNLTFTKGNGTQFSVTIPDVSGSAGDFVTTASFNSYTSSTNVRLNNLETNSASVNTSISNLNQTTASLLIETQNLELFTASALVSINNLNQSSASQQVSIDALNVFTASQSTASLVTSINELNTFSASALVSINNLNQNTSSQQVSIDALNVFTASQSTASLVTSINELNTFTSSAIVRLNNLELTSASLLIDTDNLELFSASALVSIDNLNQSTASQQVSIDSLNSKTGSYATTGSNNFVGNQNINGFLTASLQQGYVWVGNASGITTTVATSSFGGGGGAGFPYTGSAEITGSLGVTGSISGFVNSLTISSNTASMNFNDGNFFTLQLVSGSITHLTATNVKPGQTINLLVKMDSGSAAATGSLTFAPTFKFAGGFDYTPTQITASQDLVSFVTFDTTQIFAAQIKNLS